MASTAPVAVRGWVVDRQFRWPILFLLCASFGFPVLPVGLVFDPAVREKLSPDAASGVFRMMWLPLILLAFSIVYRRRRLLLSMWPEMNRSLLLLYGWVFLTMVWAPDPGATLRQAISIFGAWLLAFSEVSASWTPERWVVAMRWTALVMMVLSAIAAIAVPAIGVQPEDQFELSGSWRGITYQKNGLGQLASFGLIFFVYGFLSGSTNRRFALLGAGLSFFMVLMSRSSTATLLALIAMLQMYLLIRPPIRLGATGGVIRYGVALAILVPLLLYMLLVGAVDPESIAQSFGGLFGKDATFSGRTYIWAELLQEIPKHLWFGFGFNSFWPGGVDGPAAEIIHRLEWNVPNGHNAYLDMINEQGLVGFGLFICFLVEHIRAIRRVGQFDRPRAAMHMSLIVYIILANLTEVGWFHPIMITHVVAMFSSANVSRLLFERRLQTLKDSAAARRPDPAAGGSDAEIPAGSAARLAAWK